MKRFLFNRRSLVIGGTAALLAGCQVVPKTGPGTTGPDAGPTPEPSATSLPTDETRHRIALLVPLSGTNADVGQSIANATTMALLDTNADNLRITTYDTSGGAREAARQAVAEGNKLILGPLLASSVDAVRSEARAADVPAISFSNDTAVAGSGVYIMGQIPEQSVRRTVAYAREQGAGTIAALLPQGNYGDRAESALANALREYGGSMGPRERYLRGSSAIIDAAGKLKARGGYDAVLLGDGARLSIQAAVALKEGGANPRILGTELWSGENSLTQAGSMRGALFAAVSDGRYKRFSDNYRDRFGARPYRVGTLGYDAVLLTLRIARDWTVGRDFPESRLRDSGGFLGLDGPFRFGRDGVIERSMEVRQVESGQVSIVSPAPARFDD